MPSDQLPSDRTLQLAADEQEVLERWVRAPTTAQRLVMRSRIVLGLAAGLSGRSVARALNVSRTTVDLWRQRFLAGRCDALRRDKAGRGRKRKVRPADPSEHGDANRPIATTEPGDGTVRAQARP